MPNSGVTANTVGRLVLDAGFLYHTNTQQGVLAGVVTFDPGIAWRNAMYANKGIPLEGLDRPISYNSTLTVGFKEFLPSRIAALIPGSVLSGTPPNDIITGPDVGVFVPSLANVRAFFKMPGTSPAYMEIRFAKAFPQLGAFTGEDPGEGTYPVTYEARGLIAGPDDCPFQILFPDTIATL